MKCYTKFLLLRDQGALHYGERGARKLYSQGSPLELSSKMHLERAVGRLHVCMPYVVVPDGPA